MITDAANMPLIGLLSADTDRRLVIQTEPLLVSARDAARLVGVSERTWRAWDSSGKIPAATLNGTGVKRWLLSRLRLWSEAGCPSRHREQEGTR